MDMILMKKNMEDIKKNHTTMKTCPTCKNTNTEFIYQGLNETDVGMQDVIAYKCNDCNERYEQIFDLPYLTKMMNTSQKKKEENK